MTGRPWLLPASRAISRWQINEATTDPELRRKVTPTDAIGCKRVMLTDDWYPTLTCPNVSLVTDENSQDPINGRGFGAHIADETAAIATGTYRLSGPTRSLVGAVG